MGTANPSDRGRGPASFRAYAQACRLVPRSAPHRDRPLGRRLRPLAPRCGAPPPANSSTTSASRARSRSGPTTCSRSASRQQSGDTASVVFAVDQGRVLDAGNRPQIERVRAEIEKSPEVLAVGDPFARGAPVSEDGKITFAQIQFRKGAGDVDASEGQDDGRGHARARRQGRGPGGARRRHHPLVDGRAGRRRGDLRHPRRGARAVPDARRGRDGAAAAQRPVRDGREPRR